MLAVLLPPPPPNFKVDGGSTRALRQETKQKLKRTTCGSTMKFGVAGGIAAKRGQGNTKLSISDGGKTFRTKFTSTTRKHHDHYNVSRQPNYFRNVFAAWPAQERPRSWDVPAGCPDGKFRPDCPKPCWSVVADTGLKCRSPGKFCFASAPPAEIHYILVFSLAEFGEHACPVVTFELGLQTSGHGPQRS